MLNRPLFPFPFDAPFSIIALLPLPPHIRRPLPCFWRESDIFILSGIFDHNDATTTKMDGVNFDNNTGPPDTWVTEGSADTQGPDMVMLNTGDGDVRDTPQQ